MEYKVVEFKGVYQWVRLADGSYLVDPEYLDEFNREYPDAVVLGGLLPIPGSPGQRGLKCGSRPDQDSQA
jgi:hypothetical protein